MRLILALLVLLFLPMSAPAAVRIDSGEHADFSRLVLQFDGAVDWAFNGVSGGYELSVEGLDVTYDDSRVFKFIPRTRIQALRVGSDGRLFIQVDCKCDADAFEIRQGRIVIDIKDGAPIVESAPSIDRVQPVEPDFLQVAEQATLQFGGANVGTGTIGLDTFSAALVDADQPASIWLGDRKDVGKPSARSVEADVIPPELIQPILTEPEIRNAQPETKETFLHQEPFAEIAAADELAPFEPWFGQQPQSRLSPDRSQQFHSNLVQKLSRSMAQGLITTGPRNLDSDAIVSKKESTVALEEPGVLPSPDLDPAHLRIETAMDRDAPETETGGSTALGEITANGFECLSDQDLNIHEWGSSDNIELADLRARLLGEFDIPDQKIVVMLAKRYIYMGFGAEALMLLDEFGDEGQDYSVLRMMARTVDQEFPIVSQTSIDQLGCSSDTALWAALSLGNLPVSPSVDTRTLIQSFSGLPPHLRRQLGPGLATRFLDAGDPETATAIHSILTREAVEATAQTRLVTARLNRDLGRAEKAVEQLRQALSESGTSLVPTVIELVNATLETGQTVDAKTAELAEVLAFENQGTVAGRKLTEIAIRGYIASGEVSKSFDYLSAAAASGDVVGDLSARLLSSIHVKNVEVSNDIDFVRLALENLTSDEGVIDPPVRLAVAKRMIGLGFSSSAKMFIDGDGPEEKLLLAEIALLQRDASGALQFLQDEAGARAELVRARALEKLGRYAEASHILAAAGHLPLAQAAAWRSGDWNVISTGFEGDESSVKWNAAQLALGRRVPDGTDPAKVGDGGGFPTQATYPIRGQDGLDAPLAEGTDKIANSLRSRKIIAALLDG